MVAKGTPLQVDAAQKLQSSWHCLVPEIHIYPGRDSDRAAFPMLEWFQSGASGIRRPSGQRWSQRVIAVLVGNCVVKSDNTLDLVLPACCQGFSSVNQLVSAGRAAVSTRDGLEMRAVSLGSIPPPSYCPPISAGQAVAQATVNWLMLLSSELDIMSALFANLGSTGG